MPVHPTLARILAWMEPSAFEGLVRASGSGLCRPDTAKLRPDHARLAIDNGADGLVHLFRDRVPELDFGARVAQHRAFVIPTIVVTQGLYGVKTTLGEDPAIAPLLDPRAQANLSASFRFRAVGEPGVVASAIAQLRDAGADIAPPAGEPIAVEGSVCCPG